MKCFGTRIRVSTSAGVVKSPGVTRPAQRSWVSTSGRGSPNPPVAGSSTTARPARRPDGTRITSPTRSRSSEATAAALRWVWPCRAMARSRSAIATRSAKYSSKSPWWQAASAPYASIVSVLRCTCRARPTTDRSAWNCANEDSSSSRAGAAPTLPTRLTAMLYEGRKLERSG